MPRRSVKTDKNVYQLAREDAGLTREKAAELMECYSASQLAKVELDESYLPTPAFVTAMARAYRRPELCNYFCTRQCDIGAQYMPEVKMTDLTQIALQTLSSLNALQRQSQNLIDIAADGMIDNCELDDFIAICRNLEKLSAQVQTLRVWTDRMLAEDRIDREEYNRRLALLSPEQDTRHTT